MIAIIDYGMGNLHSVEKALHHIGADCIITKDANQLRKADKLILPGVGAFPDCMKHLQQAGLIEIIQAEVRDHKKPLLGICLGMQALFEDSEEGTFTKGLGLLQGHIVKMKEEHVKIPHIGWNLLEQHQEHELFAKMSKTPFVYYVHSYYAQNYCEEDLLGYSAYGLLNIPGLVRRGNVLGAQFHPEKSGEDGLAILTWFKEEFV